MLENLIVLVLLIGLISTCNKRIDIGLLIIANYFVTILMGLEFFGDHWRDSFEHEAYQYYYVLLIVVFLFWSVVASMICRRGNSIACLYSVWMIINAIVVFLLVLDNFNANVFNTLYNRVQDLNLLIELIAVILGTDNFLHRTSNVGKYIAKINCCIDNLFDRTGN